MFHLRTFFSLLILSLIFLQNVFSEKSTSIKNGDRCFQYPSEEIGEGMHFLEFWIIQNNCLHFQKCPIDRDGK